MVKGIRWLMLLLVVLPLLEIFVMVKVGSVIGAWTTVMLVIAAAATGVALIRMQGLITWRRVSAALARGQLPAMELIEGVVILIAGVLLVIPGFISDVLGILCLIPPVRRLIVLWVLRHALSVKPTRSDGPTPPSRPRTIDGDFKRD